MTTQLRSTVEELYKQLPPEYKGRFSLAEFMRHVDRKDMKQLVQIKQANNIIDQKYPSVRRMCEYLDGQPESEKYPNVKKICKHLRFREAVTRKLREKIKSDMKHRLKTIGGRKTGKRKRGKRKTGKRKTGKRQTHKWINPHGKFL